MPRRKAEGQEDLFMLDPENDADDATVPEGYILDFISGEKNLKDIAKEQVRQRVARALFHEYGISVEDMEGDFPARIDGQRKKLDGGIITPR